ncbi:hypothetical protein HMJ29_19900 [Hymenobacter taeanensis]|uniref:DAC domain-containing protein n=1 Tax=Hymenobacter taeanensis TaxID=2735321 RepID=A0A6M6BPY8_9BACT|nr:MULTISPECIES: hypothetical protein [Hymenobacter]QJX49045.1 hypothetical protein HMJ29_19900 [Hymenobacter taeanensis]UOQ81436.1 hypothetical protein MUN83_01130 [Hymenobacter sp. 5414T-23]
MFLSLQSSLAGSVVDFLQKSNMECLATQKGVVKLIHSLSRYTEEGQVLFPKIYVFDNEEILNSLVYFDKFYIGCGPREASTFTEGLKKIAPLALGSWNIYFKRDESTVEYGLFRSGESIISVSPWELLIKNGQKEQPAFFLQQVSEGLIELKSWNNTQLLVSFGIEDNIESPSQKIESFVKALVFKSDLKYQEQYSSLLFKLLNTVTQKKHGTISAIYSGKNITKTNEFKDGQILPKPINLIDKLKKFRLEIDQNGQPLLKNNSELDSYIQLIVGMMLSDGITIFSTTGSVLAYNVFIKDKSSQKKTVQKASGGARTRAFEYLCKLPKSKVSAVFMQSQDGAIKFFENE